MLLFSRSQPPRAMSCVSGALLSLVLLATPAAVLAHGGHGDEFQGGTAASTTTQGAIKVDAETAKRLGIKVEPVTRQRLAIGIKTTGQIEALPNQKVEVTTPVPGTLVRLLVEPGDFVKAGGAVAILSSPELAQLGVESSEKQAEARADIQEAQANLRLARENYERERQIAAADIEQARTELKVAQEQYDRDKDLVSAGALPRRQMLESQARLAEAKAGVAEANSRQDFLEAQAQLKRAQAGVEVAQSRIRLSNAAYQARLKQLGAIANSDGTITIKAPISGKVADRESSPGESFEEAGEPLMTILNDNGVLASANIYEKDLGKVKSGQQVQVKVANLPNRTFTGQVDFVGAAVEGETRVVPVKAKLTNSNGLLKPGMFAELEVLTERTSAAIVTVPNTALVEANGKQLVYVQNGNAYQPVEVTLGQTSGDTVEVKSGLFEGDLVVTQRANQLYAQSLRGGQTSEEEAEEVAPQATTSSSGESQLPWWLVIPAGGALVGAAFWAGRRTKPQLIPVAVGHTYVAENSNGSAHNGHHISDATPYVESNGNESPAWVDNHHVRNQESEAKIHK